MAITAEDVLPVTEPLAVPGRGTVPVIVIERLGGNSIHFVEVDRFLQLFKGADLSLASLAAIDGGKMGYGTLFQAWKAQGFIT